MFDGWGKKASSLLRLLAAHARDSLFAIGFAPRAPPLHPAMQGFVNANRPHWQTPLRRTAKVVLVEGFLADYGPNYLLRTGTLARAIQDETGAQPLVVTDDFGFRAHLLRCLYGSFGIKRFFYARSGLYALGCWLAATILAERVVRRGMTTDELLHLSIRGIKVGDLIYDEIIRLPGRRSFTVEHVSPEHVGLVRDAYFYVMRLARLFEEHDVESAVVTHTSYVKFGVLARLCYARDVDLYETTDMHLALFQRRGEGRLPTWHNGVRSCLERELRAITDREEAQRRSERRLAERFAGTTDNIDQAFNNKTRYTRTELCRRLNLDGSAPIAFIMAHIFTDSPHLSDAMVYRDYYQWLRETIDAVGQIPGVNWIVKAHPGASLYGEAGAVEELVAERGRAGVVRCCPQDLHAGSIRETADAIVTVQGSAALEFSCFGIPAVVSGKAYYSDFGFTYDVQTVEEHLALLRRVRTLPRLSVAQVELAKLVYCAFDASQIADENIITMETLRKTWGYGHGQDTHAAYELVTANLATNSPRAHPGHRRMMGYLQERTR